MGRFLSPDRYNALLIKQNLEAGGLPRAAAEGFLDGYLENPGNWDQYAYVRNNPLAFVDPTGEQAGHHLIPERAQYTSAIARGFTEAVRTGALSGNGIPNQPGFSTMHVAYNEAVEELLEHAEQTAGDRNTWSLTQWKTVATEILNSTEPRIRDFLDELDANNPGARAALAASISAYRITASFIARTIVSILASDLYHFARMPFLFFIDTRPGHIGGQKEKILTQHRHCLVDRKTDQCKGS